MREVITLKGFQTILFLVLIAATTVVNAKGTSQLMPDTQFTSEVSNDAVKHCDKMLFGENAAHHLVQMTATKIGYEIHNQDKIDALHASITSDVKQYPENKAEFTVEANTKHLILNFNDELINGIVITITNTFGQVVKQQFISNSIERICIQDIPHGMYRIVTSGSSANVENVFFTH